MVDTSTGAVMAAHAQAGAAADAQARGQAGSSTSLGRAGLRVVGDSSAEAAEPHFEECACPRCEEQALEALGMAEFYAEEQREDFDA